LVRQFGSIFQELGDFLHEPFANILGELERSGPSLSRNSTVNIPVLISPHSIDPILAIDGFIP
jgi:hypothetical protein